MQIDEEYFNSEDFQELLNSYEASVTSGDMMFFDADDLVDIADYYNMNGEHERAEEVVEQGLELYPHHVLLNVFMARKALDEDNLEEAVRRVENIDDTDAPDYHYIKAELLLAQGRTEEADRYLRDYGMTVPADEYGDFVKDVANLYEDYDISDKAYEWMMRSVGDDSDDFKELMGRALFGLGKYKDSERIFNELLDNHPFSTQYWTALATAQFMDEDYHNAITSSEYALAIDPQDPDSLLTKANGLMKLTNYEQAAEYFGRYAKVCPDDVIGPLHQAVCYVNTERYKEAIELLKHALTLADDDEFLAQIYQELAFAYSGEGELDRALDALDQTKALECDHIDIMVIRGHLLLFHKKAEEAEAVFRKAVEKSHGDPAVILRVIVSLYDNRYVKAAYIMLKQFFHLMVDNSYDKGYSYMALCCWELHYDREFLTYLKEAVRRNPSEARMALGHLFPEGMPVEEYYAFMKGKLKIES